MLKLVHKLVSHLGHPCVSYDNIYIILMFSFCTTSIILLAISIQYYKNKKMLDSEIFVSFPKLCKSCIYPVSLCPNRISSHGR
jgi:hypothetical protein